MADIDVEALQREVARSRDARLRAWAVLQEFRLFKPQTVLLRWRGLRGGGSKSGAVLYPEESSGYVAMNLTTGWIG